MVQGGCWEEDTVTYKVVEIAEAAFRRAHKRFHDAQLRLNQNIDEDRRLYDRFHGYKRIHERRQYCEKLMPRNGLLINIALIPAMISLVLCHCFALPWVFWVSSVLFALALAVVARQLLFEPSDAEIAAAMGPWKKRIQFLRGQRPAFEQEAQTCRVRVNQARSLYDRVRAEFERRINRRRMTNWRALRGIPFEDFLEEVFRELGFEIATTKKSGDHGGDFIISKGALRIAIQAKGSSQSVGNDAVRDAHFAMTFYNCHRCAVITNSTFTSHARHAANAVMCRLIDGSMIPQLIEGQLPI